MRWISCKEKMPPKGQTVLVWWPDKHKRMMGDGEPYIVKGGVGINKITQYNGSPNSLWWDSISSIEHFPPTHWMPLPDAPTT